MGTSGSGRRPVILLGALPQPVDDTPHQPGHTVDIAVIVNDTDADGDMLRSDIATQPTHGFAP